MNVINLLPPNEQELIRKEQSLATLKKFLAFSLASYVLVALVMVGARFYMQSNLSDLDREISDATKVISKQDNSTLARQVQYYNSVITDYNNLVAVNPKWSGVLESFAQLVPAGVQIQTFNGSTKTGLITITGKSTTRDAVLLLRSNIAASPLFMNIDLPLENLATPTNVTFHYSFYLQNNVLTK